jgi:redox-sensing transcriptional repressor
MYSHYLTYLENNNSLTVSSGAIASGVGVTPAQVRKDLAYFGDFGLRGVGYCVKDLQKNIRQILSLEREWKVALVGMGNLGIALATYKGFRERGFQIVCAFDNDPAKIGQNLGGIDIFAQADIIGTLPASGVEIGIICVPFECAQKAADALVAGQVKAILNFACVNLVVPPSVFVRNVDLSVQLEILTYHVQC